MTVFDLSWGHFLAVAVVALIVIGPKELPGVLRTIGQWTTKIRRMAAEFQGQFQEALREAEMADLRKEIDTIHDTAAGVTSSLNNPVHLDEAMKWEPNPGPAKPDTPGTDTPSTDIPSTDPSKPDTPAAGRPAAEPSPAEPSKPEATSAPETAPAVAASEFETPATAMAAAGGAHAPEGSKGGVGP